MTIFKGTEVIFKSTEISRLDMIRMKAQPMRYGSRDREQQEWSRQPLGRDQRDEYSNGDDEDHGRHQDSHFVPPEDIPKFYGQEDQPEVGRRWLKTFEYVIDNACWGNRQIVQPFALAMKKSADYWFQRLPRDAKRGWKSLKMEFQREFVERRVSRRSRNTGFRDEWSRRNLPSSICIA